MNVLFLCTDAFGGHGGIAKFNRDLCSALAAHPLEAHVTALPRVKPSQAVADVPPGVDYRTEVAGSKISYTLEALHHAVWAAPQTPDLILCGHINLLPVAAVASSIKGVPLLLVLHGIEAWSAHASMLVRRALSQVNAFVAVSQYTKERFLEWAPLSPEQGHVIPNCIDLDAYGPGAKRKELLDRYSLSGRTVLLTLGRLSSEEQYKGHDEVLEVLPELADDIPDISYLVCGDGDDRPRLEAKAERLGISDRVVFAGYVPEGEKADHYHLADAFVMPGRGEGFGIVYLEALACGIPVVASSADASREAVRRGKLGEVVDPDDLEDVERGIRKALRVPHGRVPSGLEYFSEKRFQKRWHSFVNGMV